MSHLNIYNAVDVLKYVQAYTYIRIRSKDSIRKYKNIDQKEMYLSEQTTRFNSKTYFQLNSMYGQCP